MASPRGLGKGLDALFGNKLEIKDSTLEDGDNKLKNISIEELEPGPFQPRNNFSQEAIEELAQSIKTQGLLQPILVRQKRDSNKYEIIAGERRYLASKKAGLKEIPALVCTLSDEECLVVSLVENLQREDLNVIEEARALEKIRSLLNITQEELANRVGKSRPHIANTLRLLQLEEEILEGISQGKISAGHGRALLGITSSEDRFKVYQYLLKKNASVRDVERIANFWKKNKTLPKYCELSSTNRPTTEDKNHVKKITNALKSQLGLKTTVRGTLSSGSITIKYTSKEELISFLKRLKITETFDFEENVSHETIDDKELSY